MLKSEVYKGLLNKFGKRHQLMIAIEEFSELQKEICKLLRQKPVTDDLLQEIADCEIMLEQLKAIVNQDSRIAYIKRYKLLRAEERYLK